MPEREVPPHTHAPAIEEPETGISMEQLQAVALGLHQDDSMALITPITNPTTPPDPTGLYVLGFAQEIGVAWQVAKQVGSRLYSVEIRRSPNADMSNDTSLGEFYGFSAVDDDNNRKWGVSTTRYYQIRTVARSGEQIYFSNWSATVSGTTLAAGSSNTDLQTRMDTFAAQVQNLHLLPGVPNLSALSQAVSVLSQQISVLSQKVSVLSSLPVVSVTSNEASAISAQAASAINVVSNAVSVVSQALSVQAAALSVRVDTQSQSISVLSQGLSVVSNAASNALSVANAASNAASVVSAAVNVVSNALSNELSVRAAAINVVSNAVSVVSQALSVETANRTSAVSTLLPTAPGGRLTLTTATPVLIAAVTSATVIYYTPYVHQLVPIYDGTVWAMFSVAEISITIDTTNHLSGTNYDLFVVNDAGTRRLGTGAAWTTNTARAEALARLNGIWTNNASFTFRYSSVATLTVAANRATYVGTFRASANGQTEFSFGGLAAGGTEAKFYLWNCYNRRPMAATVRNGTDSWTYDTNTWRSQNTSDAMRVSMVLGLSEDAILGILAQLASSSGGNNASFAIALDVTNTYAQSMANAGGTIAISANAIYLGLPGLGYHFLQAIENSGGATSTYYGDAGVPTQFQSGFHVRGVF